MSNRIPWCLVVIAGGLLIAGCRSGSEVRSLQSVSEKDVEFPAWIDQPCQGHPSDTICAVGESDFAATDIEAAKTDAESAAKNRIADQIKARNTRLISRVNSVIKDHGNGKTIGQRDISDINNNFTDQALQGLRFTNYFYYPNRSSPQKIYVRAMLAPNGAEMSKDIIDAMLGLSQTEKMKINHQNALDRLESVRQQYLQETQSNRTDTAPSP